MKRANSTNYQNWLEKGNHDLEDTRRLMAEKIIEFVAEKIKERRST